MPKRKGTSLLKIKPIYQSGGSSPLIEWKLISKDVQKRNPRTKVTQFWATFDVKHNFQPILDLTQYKESIDNAFETAMKPLIKGCSPNDLIGFYIENENLEYQIYLRPLKAQPFDRERFLNQIYVTCQSNRSFLNNGLLSVRVTVIPCIEGHGRSKNALKTYDEFTFNKQSIIKIKNEDSSCGYRAIAFGILYHEWNVKGKSHQTTKWRNLLLRETAQKEALRKFFWITKLDPSLLENEIPLTNAMLPNIVEKIGYQIIVIEKGIQVFRGADKEKVIYLHLEDKHYDLIKSMPGYLDRRFYCKYCNIGYQNAKDHRCEDSCYLCRSHFKCIPSEEKKCKECKVTFVSQKCFKNHEISGICKERHRCEICLRDFIVEKRKHNCDEFHCNICNEYYKTQPHYCHLSPIDFKKVTEEDAQNKILIAYDIECMLELVKNKKSLDEDMLVDECMIVDDEDMVEEEKGKDVFSHTPILLISHTVCDKCLKNKADICKFCGVKELLLYGEDCVTCFVQYLSDISKRAEKSKTSITCFAHNSSGYDGHFILKELLSREIQGIEPILNGTKIMKLDVGNIRFIDSLLLFQRPLADLPKMFGLSSGAKGFFPHYFNKPENRNWSDMLEKIGRKEFGYKFMSTERALEFKLWYKENKLMNYNLKEEMIKYCRSDVRILMESMISFRKLFIETTQIDPLTRCFTLASIGLEFFRTKILPKDTIGITPIGGYKTKGNQSLEGKAWLDIMDEEWKTYGEIIREFKIGKYFADGVINGSFSKNGQTFKKIAFEFNGCWVHGHNCKNNYNEDKLKKVEEKRKYYLSRNIWPEFVWECELLKKAPERFYERYAYHQKILKDKLFCDPRKALHGGRTNNLKFSCKAEPGEDIRYLDFTSLYPYVLARKSFPRSHPIVIRSFETTDVSNYFGFVSCKVLPPQKLYLPVLPYSSKGKLIFPLCRTCADERNEKSCSHPVSERCLTDTFVSVELQKAVSMGYEVIEIYEVLHYPEKITDLFKEYINTWYKIKTEASGYPKEYITEEEREIYVNKFMKKEGIRLESDKIKPNPGLRNTAKLMLNSLWGKLAQRPDLPVTKIFKDYREIWDIANDENLKMMGDVQIDNMMLVSYKYNDIENCKVGNTSVAFASFVTAYARLELYEALEKIEEDNILYFDTDSIVFVQKGDKCNLTISNFLGEMTDEIKGEYGMDAKMAEFYSTGPKSYAFKVINSKGEHFKIKAKGLTQTIGAKDLNFGTIKLMAMEKALGIKSNQVMVPQQQFNCNKQHIVSSKHFKKRLKVTSDKRRINRNKTLPYGYVE